MLCCKTQPYWTGSSASHAMMPILSTIQHGKFQTKSCSFIHGLQRVTKIKEKEGVSFTFFLHLRKMLTIHFLLYVSIFLHRHALCTGGVWAVTELVRWLGTTCTHKFTAQTTYKGPTTARVSSSQAGLCAPVLTGKQLASVGLLQFARGCQSSLPSLCCTEFLNPWGQVRRWQSLVGCRMTILSSGKWSAKMARVGACVVTRPVMVHFLVPTLNAGRKGKLPVQALTLSIAVGTFTDDAYSGDWQKKKIFPVQYLSLMKHTW